MNAATLPTLQASQQSTPVVWPMGVYARIAPQAIDQAAHLEDAALAPIRRKLIGLPPLEAPRSAPTGRLRLGAMLMLLPHFLWESVRAGLDIARRALAHRFRRPWRARGHLVAERLLGLLRAGAGGHSGQYLLQPADLCRHAPTPPHQPDAPPPDADRGA